MKRSLAIYLIHHCLRLWSAYRLSPHQRYCSLRMAQEKVAKDEVLPQPQKVSLWHFHAESDLHLYFGSCTGIKNLCTETLRQLSCDAKARKEVALNTGLAGCYVNISASRASESPTNTGVLKTDRELVGIKLDLALFAKVTSFNRHSSRRCLV